MTRGQLGIAAAAVDAANERKPDCRQRHPLWVKGYEDGQRLVMRQLESMMIVEGEHDEKP
jgi:hypothetical protein